MKLYTEEQVRQIFENLSTWTGYDYTMETYSDSLTPIELPSDEKIQNNAYTDRIVDDWEHEQQIGFERGAKWMREQILNQNK